MRVQKTSKNLSKVLLTLITIGVLTSFQNVSACKVSRSRSTTITTGIFTAAGLVILFSVNHASGRSVQNGREILDPPSSTMPTPRRFPTSSESSEDASLPAYFGTSKGIKTEKKVTRSRVARQLGFIAPALQTMGCLPKFFCGMNSKAPSDSSSTLNDLAYLIKFAMVEEPDSIENKGKDGLNSDENSDEALSEERLQNKKFEHLADQELIMDDPEYLSFMWKDMKTKLKTKLKDSKADDEVLQQMMDEIDYEDKTSFRLPSLFSGLSNLVRLGRSVRDNLGKNKTLHRRKRSNSFWDTQEFDEQMKLAARVGQTDSTDEKCTSTFNLCPYTIGQMKNMITGTKPKPTVPWYLNSDGPKPNISTTTKPPRKPTIPTLKPNKLSNLIYALNPNSLEGHKPINPITTKKPTIKKPYLGVKPENDDDETGYDSLALNLELPTNNIKIIKLQQIQQQQKQQQQAATASLEEMIDGFATSSEEENKEVKLKVPKRPIQPQQFNNQTKKRPIGLPRPKYAIRNKSPKVPQGKVRPKPNKDKDESESTEDDVDSSQEKDDEEGDEASSEEKDSDLKIIRQPGNNKIIIPLRPKQKQKLPKDPKLKESEKNKESNSNNKGKSDHQKDVDDSQQDVSSEEKQSSEEHEAKGNRRQPQSNQNDESQNNNRHRPQNHPLNKNRFNKPEYSEDSNESEYSEEGQLKKETIRPINYSYFNGKPRPTQPVHVQQHQPQHYPKGSDFKNHQNHGFNQEQRPGNVERHPDFDQQRPNNDQPPPGFNHQQQPYQNQRPVSKPSKGFFSSIFGGSKKTNKPQQSHQRRPPIPNGQQQNNNGPPRPQNHYPENQRPPSTHPTGQNSHENRPPSPQNDYPQNHGPNPNQEFRQDEDSEEPQPPGPPPPPVPQVFGNGDNPRPPNDQTSLNQQPGNRPNRPPPRIPQYHSGNPNRPIPPGGNNKKRPQNRFRPQPPSINDENEDNNKDASNQDDKSEEASESKENDNNKTEESKESAEAGGVRVKDIFSKSSIATLGSNDNNNHRDYRPPPPPPIANFRPTEPSTTTTTTAKPLPTSPVFPPKPNSSFNYNNNKDDDDSAENEKIGADPEEDRSIEDKSDEGNSSEEIKKPRNKKKKVEDDEAENREPPRNSFNHHISELGEVVVATNEFKPSGLMAPLPPVSNFANTKNQIKVPMSKKPGTNAANMLESSSRRPTRNPDTKNTNSGPSPGGLPSLPNPGSGMRPGGAGMRPGMGNNNRRPGNNNNRQPGNGQESSEENSEELGNSSEETIGGGSSEEDEENTKRDRSSINIKKLSKLDDKKSNKSKNELQNSDTTPSTTTQKYLPVQTNSKPVVQNPYTMPSLSFKDVTESYYNKFSTNNEALPPIFRWNNKQPPQVPKPKPRRPVKQQQFGLSKPLNPKMVQYLRETYGNAVRIPERATTPRSNSKPSHKKGSIPKRRRRPAISYSDEGDDDEMTKVGRKSSEEIDFDEFFHVGDGIGNDHMTRRQGEAYSNSTASVTLTTVKPRFTLPPIYGKLKKRRRH